MTPSRNGGTRAPAYASTRHPSTRGGSRRSRRIARTQPVWPKTTSKVPRSSGRRHPSARFPACTRASCRAMTSMGGAAAFSALEQDPSEKIRSDHALPPLGRRASTFLHAIQPRAQAHAAPAASQCRRLPGAARLITPSVIGLERPDIPAIASLHTPNESITRAPNVAGLSSASSKARPASASARSWAALPEGMKHRPVNDSPSSRK
jgi:hypothetical protein